MSAQAILAQDINGPVLRCGCCGLPWARIEGGALVVESRHGGTVHVNTVSVAALGLLVGETGKVGEAGALSATNGEVWGYVG